MTPAHEVFTASELARAIGVADAAIHALIADGTITTVGPAHHGLLSGREAIHAGRRLSALLPRPAIRRVDVRAEAPVLSLVRLKRQATGVPLAMSSLLHAALIAGVVLVASGRASTFPMTDVTLAPEPLRLVYLATPGPGGGGGGGGRRDTEPPAQAKQAGSMTISNPVPKRAVPPPVKAAPAPLEPPPPPIDAEPVAPIAAPVAILGGDVEDRQGVVEDTDTEAERHGSGDGGGEGTGSGTGLGEGNGPGIGPGSGGGIGGGPYRPGSGVEPPRLLREVKPNYPESARRRGIVGDVVLEIVVLSDGGVGAVRMIQRLSPALDRQAVSAVRQWRFAPATLRGTPVDVLVEVAVEFKQR